jgi:predicted RNA polymerase sigma factor
LEDSDCQRTVKAKLREGASSIRYKVPENIEEKWERIKNVFQDICKSTLGPENNAKKDF